MINEKAKRHWREWNRAEWQDWKWQLKNSIRGVDELKQVLNLSNQEEAGIREAEQKFRWSVTPYCVSTMDPDDSRCPVRLQQIPRPEELEPDSGTLDPLREKSNSPVDSVVHVYANRVAFKVINVCPTYCRYCFREYFVGDTAASVHTQQVEEGIAYISSQKRIRDVLLTGGDPLLMTDERICDLVRRVAEIPHVEIVRIGTRTPCTLPQRITPELVRRLKDHGLKWLNTHFNHAKELTPEAVRACDNLVDGGIPVGNQSVLLRGVNDSVTAMMELSHELLKHRVRPYYIYQCQTLVGTAHLRVPIERGIEIMDGLRGHTTGFGVPTYVLDTPYGKVPLNRSGFRERDGDYVVVEAFDGRVWREHNPQDVSSS